MSKATFLPFDNIPTSSELHLKAFDRFPRSIPRVKSIAAFLKVVGSLHSKATCDGNPSPLRFYFRGQPGPYPLLPKILRPKDSKKLLKAHIEAFGNPYLDLNTVQSNMIFRLARYAEQYHPTSGSLSDVNDYLSWMCLAQHHGLPTFLLDWAVNPLAALFFACDNTSSVDETLDGVIWFLELKTTLERSCTSLLHLEKIPFHLDEIEHGDVDEVLKICRSTRIVEDQPKIIVPRMLTRRIEVQAGRFLASSCEMRVNYIETSPDHIAWRRIFPLAVIPMACKVEILQELRTLRIHRGSMYADLDSYAKFLAEGCL